MYSGLSADVSVIAYIQDLVSCKHRLEDVQRASMMSCIVSRLRHTSIPQFDPPILPAFPSLVSSGRASLLCRNIVAVVLAVCCFAARRVIVVTFALFIISSLLIYCRLAIMCYLFSDSFPFFPIRLI